MFLEIVAQDLKDVIEINKSHIADQIELCAGLKEGALTPSLEVIKECCENSRIPIRIILKPNSSIYISDKEFDQLKNIIIEIKKTKAFGIVFGWIDQKSELEYARIKELCELAKPLKLTFYRSIDDIKDDKVEAIKKLQSFGFDTILTTGSISGNAHENILALKELENSVKNIRILCCKGINVDRAKKLLQFGLTNIHVGTAVRKNDSWDEEILVDKINEFAK